LDAPDSPKMQKSSATAKASAAEKEKEEDEKIWEDFIANNKRIDGKPYTEK